MSATIHLRARYVFPVEGDPIDWGVVSIEGGRIAAVGAGAAGGEVEDLGNVALLPGLINAHAHLDLAALPRPIGPAGIGFVDWLREVIALGTRTEGTSIAHGAAEALQSGTTLLVDIAQPQPGEDLPASAGELLAPAPAILSLLELIGPTAERAQAAMERAEGFLFASGRPRPGRGLAPHAPYTVRPELLDHTVGLCAAAGATLAMHLAESAEEIEWLHDGGGPLADLLAERGIDAAALAIGPRPLDYLRRLQRAGRVLVVHGNYLDEEEIAFLAARAERMAVVCCPRTHAHFGHRRDPLEAMLAAGVGVVLGSDSRASAPELDMLAELRFAARRHPRIAPPQLLAMATLEAARALGLAGRRGSIVPGKRADLVAVELPAREGDPHQLLLDESSAVCGVWLGGSPAPR